MKKIFIFHSIELSNYIIVLISDQTKEFILIKLKKKYKFQNIDFIYSADFVDVIKLGSENIRFDRDQINHASLSLRLYLEKNKSGLGDEVYKSNINELLDIVFDSYNENYEISNSYKTIIDSKEKLRNDSKLLWNKCTDDEEEFINKNQVKFEKINNLWKDFWDTKIHDFKNKIIEAKISELKFSYFFHQRNIKRHDEEIKELLTELNKYLELWRIETKKLPQFIRINCRNCDAENSIKVVFLGPNVSKELIGIPEYGKKQKSNIRYYHRGISHMKGVCENCSVDIFTKEINGLHVLGNIAKYKNSDECSIYPYDDKQSLYDWCLVWRTIFEWYIYEIHGYQNSGSELMNEYNNIYSFQTPWL